jgi:hypothetical protein
MHTAPVIVAVIVMLVVVFALAPRMAERNARATRWTYGRDPSRGVQTLTVWVLRAASAFFAVVIAVALLR